MIYKVEWCKITSLSQKVVLVLYSIKIFVWQLTFSKVVDSSAFMFASLFFKNMHFSHHMSFRSYIFVNIFVKN